MSAATSRPLLDYDSKERTVILRAPDSPYHLELPAGQCRLEFERCRVDRFLIEECSRTVEGILLRGSIEGTSLKFTIHWRVRDGEWFAKQVVILGTPEPTWGRLLRFHVLDFTLPPGGWDDGMGWRETNGDLSLLDRKSVEEGGGFLPPFGYPVFSERMFFGLEHPMGVNCVQNRSLELYHHPCWQGARLESFSAVIGFRKDPETVETAFQRYVRTVRQPPPDRARVEINTFWTDRFESEAGVDTRYVTDLPSYQRLIEEWADRVLMGERGLVTSILLDAGWQDPKSLYRPQESVGGPGDEGLKKLSDVLQSRGMELGLWWSWNGPIGISDRWLEQQGYRVSASGVGAGYSCAGGRIRYACLTDPAFEEAIGKRLEEVMEHVPVTFFKGDWDNDGVEDPALFPKILPLKEHMKEANVEAMIRLHRRASARNVRFRGGWWTSPWWTCHVNNTHLPNSGDCEAADVPALTQRDALITSRDTLLHHVMVTCRAPIPWDFICNHEFASAPRNPVQDTDESWLNNLIMWIARGSHYLQIYMPPYNLRGWRAWTLRETLRWYRAHEDLLWKCPQRMIGGKPGSGEIYGYLHEDGPRRLLVLRNPMGFPQKPPTPEELGLGGKDWHRIFPVWETWDWNAAWMPSHAVWILVQGDATWRTKDALMRDSDGWTVPFHSAPTPVRHKGLGEIPALHDFPDQHMEIERRGRNQMALHANLPYGHDEVEWILRYDLRDGRLPRLRAATGRYPDGLSTAPMPIRWLQSHWRVGWGQNRMGMKPHDPNLAIARIPSGSGGSVHLFLQSEEDLPSFTAGWIEGEEARLPLPDQSRNPNVIPPSQPRRKTVLGSFQPPT